MADTWTQAGGLFDEGNPRTSERVYQRLEMPDADVQYFDSFFSLKQSDVFLEELERCSNWKQEQIKLYGKWIPFPRLTAWYGDAGKVYTYSGITVTPDPWTPTLLAIKKEIEAVTPVVFNSVLVNYYRGERDSVAWHSDDEPELGTNPVIGSVSFGATRSFQMKHKTRKELRQKINLSHGSFLLMQGPTQHFWLHQVPKETKKRPPRINLTFRVIH